MDSNRAGPVVRGQRPPSHVFRTRTNRHKALRCPCAGRRICNLVGSIFSSNNVHHEDTPEDTRLLTVEGSTRDLPQCHSLTYQVATGWVPCDSKTLRSVLVAPSRHFPLRRANAYGREKEQPPTEQRTLRGLDGKV